jgi:flagellar hook-length control protein FliK
MLFNPLFIQTTGQTDASCSVLQSKLSNSSYLFSDIIKIINENTIGTGVVNPTDDSQSTADVTNANADSSNPIEHLFTSNGENLFTDKVNISLNDLFKKLLISSNSEEIQNSVQADNSTKESTSSDKTTSTLQKSDIKSLLQGLSAILSKLNIAPDSLQQVVNGNTDPGSSNQNGNNENLNATSQTGNSIAELVINLSKATVSKDSSTTSVSTENATDSYGVSESLVEAISTLLGNITKDSLSESTVKTSTDNSEADDSNQKVPAEAEQLAASMFNMFQNNNALVLNINSDSGNIKIEISKNAADTVQQNDTDSGAVLSAKNQSDSSVNMSKQSVNVNTSENGQEIESVKSGNIASPVFTKTKDSSPSNTGESTESFFTKIQASSSKVSDNPIDYANTTKNENSTNAVKATGVFFTKEQTNSGQAPDNINNYVSTIKSDNSANTTGSFVAKEPVSSNQVFNNSSNYTNTIKSDNSANITGSFVVKEQVSSNQVFNNSSNYTNTIKSDNSANTTGSFVAKEPVSSNQVSDNPSNYTSTIKSGNSTNTTESFFVKAQTNQNSTLSSNIGVSSDKINNINPLNNTVAIDSDNTETVVVTISTKLNNDTPITDARNTNTVKTVNLNSAKDDISKNDGNITLKDYKLSVSNDKTEVAEKVNIDALSNNKAFENITVKANAFTGTKTSTLSAKASSVDPKAEVKDAAADSEYVNNLSKTNDLSALSSGKYTQSVPDDLSTNITAKASQISQTGIANSQPDNSSTGITGDTVQVKTDTAEVGQALNTKHSNNSSDQQQSKSSDNKNGSNSKEIDPVTGNLFSQAADSVKEKFVSQAAATDVPEKTIKITEITKEISNIIQQNSIKSVVLQLKPESLGKIKVTVDVDNNLVSAKVEVDNEAVKQIVQNNSLELTHSLNSNGMHLSSLSVSVSSGEQKSYQPSAQKKKSGYSSSSKIMEDSVSLSTAKSLGYNTYEYLA